MAWFKVDDNFYCSKKFLMIKREHQVAAAGVWMLAGTWSASQMTDGFVPHGVMALWEFDEEIIESLVSVGLWDYDEQRQGIVFHDWFDYQPSREQLLAKTLRTSEARSNAANKRWNKVDANSMQTDAKVVQKDAPEPVPVPLKEHSYSKAAQNDYSKDFETFWSAYPRKQAKGEAWKAWKSLNNVRPSIEVLVQACATYELTVTDATFFKHPGPWLRARRWEDLPTTKTQPATTRRNETSEEKDARIEREESERQQARINRNGEQSGLG